jgi:hypothetical protein
MRKVLRNYFSATDSITGQTIYWAQLCYGKRVIMQRHSYLSENDSKNALDIALWRKLNGITDEKLRHMKEDMNKYFLLQEICGNPEESSMYWAKYKRIKQELDIIEKGFDCI